MAKKKGLLTAQESFDKLEPNQKMAFFLSKDPKPSTVDKFTHGERDKDIELPSNGIGPSEAVAKELINKHNSKTKKKLLKGREPNDKK